MLPTQACASHTGPQGCFVHCWNVHVERCLWLHPIRTMRTGPIHEVPAYTHQPNSHFPHGWCTIMCPPYTLSIDILSISLHPGAAMHVLIQSHHHIWMQSPTSSPTSWSDPASTLAPEALLLGG